MRISLVLSMVFISGCKHIGLLFEPPSTLKAVVQGVINGANVHCEKTLTLGHGKWEVMCKVSDEIDIKYRTQPLNNNQTKLEILIDKQKGDSRKIIAAPVLIVGKDKVATLASVSDKGRLDIRAEPAR